jgi:hypothetical protein
MKHCAEEVLALAAAGELTWREKWQVEAHTWRCPACRNRLAEYRADRQRVKTGVAAFSLPRAVDWDELEQEMMANIRLGLEVNALFPPAPSPVTASMVSWRGAVAVGALTAIVITGWLLTGPGSRPYLRGISPEAAQVRSGSLLLRADETGVGVESKGKGLILRSAAASRVEVGLEGTLRSSSVDLDSGQVTVSQIYAE